MKSRNQREGKYMGNKCGWYYRTHEFTLTLKQRSKKRRQEEAAFEKEVRQAGLLKTKRDRRAILPGRVCID